MAAIAYPTTKIRVNATWRKCPHKVHRMEMKTAISCTILRQDRKSGSAGMPRPISYAVFCLKKKIIVRNMCMGAAVDCDVCLLDTRDIVVRDIRGARTRQI